MSLFDPNFEVHPWPYIIQISIAGTFMMFIFAAFNLYTQTALVASLASSAFVAFTVPNSHATDARPMLGGYIVAVIVGIAISLIYHSAGVVDAIDNGLSALFGNIGFSVGGQASMAFFAFLAFMTAAFTMAATDTEHAPAIGIAIGLVMNRWDIMTLLFIFTGILFLIGFKKLFERWMIDLI
jgi:hypothetical protein